MIEFNEEGPVYGPNGEWELDPDNDQCGYLESPVFATCKNNCPGGESSVLSYFAIITKRTHLINHHDCLIHFSNTKWP